VLRLEGWVAYRVPQPSAADVVALKAGHAPLLVQVKSTARAYERFGPAERAVRSRTRRSRRALTLRSRGGRRAGR
jgi:hypothetical protein